MDPTIDTQSSSRFQFDLDEDLKALSTDGLLMRDGDEDSSQFSMSPHEQHDQDAEMCLRMFENWNCVRQTEFVEQLISRMSFHQHEHIYSILMPMLQRDFITALPSKFLLSLCCCLCARESCVSF